MDNTTPQAIAEVFAKYPNLDPDGFQDKKMMRKLMRDVNCAKEHAAWQNDIIEHAQKVEEVRQWIRDNLTLRSTYNLGISSYGLKHLMQDDIRHLYCDNGFFITAMVLEGYKPKIEYEFLRCYFRISLRKRSVRLKAQRE